jgi:hypothetical protein
LGQNCDGMMGSRHNSAPYDSWGQKAFSTLQGLYP